MKPRTFNSIMHYINEDWAAKVLHMQRNPSPGPDLISDNKVIECKFKLLYPEKYTHISWRVLGYQMNYDNQEKPAYWALGTYTLNKPIANINTTNPKRLENLVGERNLTIVNWNWMKQFAIYHHSGKTEHSEWNHDIIFPKKSALPQIIKKYKVLNGEICFTEGVDLNQFDINLF